MVVDYVQDCRLCSAVRDNMIIKNAAKCLKCGETIESKHRHDFVSCSCGNLFVDGGKDYLHRGYIDESMVQELSVQFSEETNDFLCTGN